MSQRVSTRACIHTLSTKVSWHMSAEAYTPSTNAPHRTVNDARARQVGANDIGRPRWCSSDAPETLSEPVVLGHSIFSPCAPGLRAGHRPEEPGVDPRLHARPHSSYRDRGPGPNRVLPL